MALGSTQPITEMSTRNLPGGKKRPARRADNLTAIYKPIVSKMWEPRHLTNLFASTACYRDSLSLLNLLPNSNILAFPHYTFNMLVYFHDSTVYILFSGNEKNAYEFCNAYLSVSIYRLMDFDKILYDHAIGRHIQVVITTWKIYQLVG
jgi:hypothetical protein